MPTSRLMQFSLTGGGEEAIDENGKRGTRPLPGVSSAHFLKLVEERSQIGFWTSDFVTGIVTTSLGLYRLLGIDPSTAIGRHDLIAMTHPDDQPIHDDIYQTLRSGHAIDREFRIIRPDATMRWLQNKAEIIVDAEGCPTRSIGVISDVTDQHSARQSLEEGYRYKALVKSMAAVEFRVKSNGDVIHRDGWYELTGQTEAEASVSGWLDVIHPDDREKLLLLASSLTGSGGPRAVDHRIRCADGQYRWFLARAAPFVDPEGAIREWVGALIETAEYHGGKSERLDLPATTLQPSHIRAARALLDWTVKDLAREAGVSVSSVSRLETEAHNSVRDRLLQSVRKAFERHGVSFAAGPRGDLSIHFTGPVSAKVRNAT